MTHRSLSTWLFSTWLLACSAASGAAAQQPTWCLPPIFDGGQRLHGPDGWHVFWLDPLFRQHEVCWRTPERPDEARVLLIGNSAIYGFPLPVEETVAYLLNRLFSRDRVAAHVFNLAAVATYQLKDALIIHEALKYRPDMIVYPLTLAEFARYPATLADFAQLPPQPWHGLLQVFESNRGTIQALAKEQPAGLSEPVDLFNKFLENSGTSWYGLAQEQLGTLIRTAARAHARSLLRRLVPDAPPQTELPGRQTHYDCGQTKRQMDLYYRDWQRWNIIAYLAQIRDATGVTVVLVNWPVAHEPVGDCYNVRYTNAALEQYDVWLRAQAEERQLPYVDLHDMLRADEFVDSLHVMAPGQRKIAERLAPVLEALLTTRR